MALAPALRRLPALKVLNLNCNPFGDEGLAALVAPLPLPAAGALPPPTGGLAKLKEIYLGRTQITAAGCADLASALRSGALPALDSFYIEGSRLRGQANTTATAAVHEAITARRLPPSAPSKFLSRVLYMN